jgi:hypothetical protein
MVPNPAKGTPLKIHKNASGINARNEITERSIPEMEISFKGL